MSDAEKNVSFLNRYFIFKKNRNVDTNKIAKILKINEEKMDEEEEKEDIENEKDIIVKPKAKKLKKAKIIIE